MKNTRPEGRRPHKGFCCVVPRTHTPRAPSRVLLQRALPGAILLRIALCVRHIPSPTDSPVPHTPVTPLSTLSRTWSPRCLQAFLHQNLPSNPDRL